jgi:GTP diphosphokinase / guanosine-3',5'-bis(diphosphate) 3'-diphosphatase
MRPDSSATFQKWLEILMCFRNTKSNRELILTFFFDQFTVNPELFYDFIVSFKKHLKGVKNKEIKMEVALKYLNVLSFLCGRFGLYSEKESLDDYCFKIVNPQAYLSVATTISKYQKDSEGVIKRIHRELTRLLSLNGYCCVVKGRFKNVYSIHKKLLKKKIDRVQSLHDIFAFRIITEENNERECFDILNLLHDHFYPLAHRFKDYISIPKINGYQSLHTGLTGLIPGLDLPVEVQIRTSAMHEFSERGVASHFMYERDKKAKLVSDQEKRLLDYFTSLNPGKAMSRFLYCFSHEGDVFKLRKGSTVLDFAQRIHSSLAKRAKSAEVNGQAQSIRYKIREGDFIKVIPSSGAYNPMDQGSSHLLR